MRPKHLQWYEQEFAGRHDTRDMDTIEIMGTVVLGMDGKRLKYADLVEANGLDSGAQVIAG